MLDLDQLAEEFVGAICCRRKCSAHAGTVERLVDIVEKERQEMRDQLAAWYTNDGTPAQAVELLHNLTLLLHCEEVPA